MTNFNPLNLIYSVLIAFCFYAPISSAMIHEEGDNTVRITYGELDVSQQKGVEVLYQRIKTAARKVCDTNDNRTRSLSNQHAAKKCFNNAVNNTVNKIDNNILNTLHSG